MTMNVKIMSHIWKNEILQVQAAQWYQMSRDWAPSCNSEWSLYFRSTWAKFNWAS